MRVFGISAATYKKWVRKLHTFSAQERRNMRRQRKRFLRELGALPFPSSKWFHDNFKYVCAPEDK